MTTQTANGHGVSAVRNALANFTSREEHLMSRLRASGFDLARLPERLAGWRFWVGDSAIYLHELKNFADSIQRAEAA